MTTVVARALKTPRCSRNLLEAKFRANAPNGVAVATSAIPADTLSAGRAHKTAHAPRQRLAQAGAGSAAKRLSWCRAMLDPSALLTPPFSNPCFGGTRRSQIRVRAEAQTWFHPLCPPPTRWTPANIPSVASLGDSGNNTPHPAPWEAANCRHHHSGQLACEPHSPIRRPAVPPAAVATSPPFQTMPTTTLGTKSPGLSAPTRNASGSHLQIPLWACRPQGRARCCLLRRAARARGSACKRRKGTYPLTPHYSARDISRRNPTATPSRQT